MGPELRGFRCGVVGIGPELRGFRCGLLEADLSYGGSGAGLLEADLSYGSSGAGLLEADLSYGSSGAGSLEWDLSYGLAERWMGRESRVKGPRRERRSSWLPRLRLIAVAVSGSIGGVGYAGGSETRPY
jgi:hypothetical protein